MGLSNRINNIVEEELEGVVLEVSEQYPKDDVTVSFADDVNRVTNSKLAIIKSRIVEELAIKEVEIKAILSRESRYIKMARPTFTYFGIAIIFINYTIIPLLSTWLGGTGEALELPTEFWVAFGSVTGLYAVGRSYEKGTVNKQSKPVTDKSDLFN